MNLDRMSAEQIEAVKKSLAEVLRRPFADRPQFLTAHSQGDETIRGEVGRLLGLHDQAGDFLESSIPEQLGVSVPKGQHLGSGTALGNRYLIDQLLSKGGFSTVYLARDRSLAGKRVVVKVLDRIYFDKARRAAFSSELHALAQLNHPGIVGISDTGELNDGTPYLVLNYVPGLTLREALDDGALPMERVYEIVLGIGKALGEAHRRGICHLDLKPENVILSDPGTVDERVTVIDFGIAQLKARSGESLAAGSSSYVAPRSLSGTQRDIYSFALVAFEIVTGRLPDLNKDLDRQLSRKCSARSRRAIASALGISGARRFSSVGEFVKAFGVVDNIAVWKMARASTILAVPVAAVLFVMMRRPAVPPEPSRPIPLVATPGFEYRPSFSPDGKWIFYTSGPEGHFDIYKKALSGGDPVPLVTGPENDDRPQVSPDGNTLAFLRGGFAGVAVTLKNLDTGREEEVGRAADLDSFTWAPDGRSLVITQGFSQEGTRRLRILDLQSRGWRDLVPSVPGSRGDMRPAFSPDGNYLAFVRRWNRASADLFVVQVDSHLKVQGAPRALTERSERIESVQWTPDSQSLLYVAGPLGEGSIWRIPVKGGMPVPFLSPALRVESISVPKRDWKLAYSCHLSDTNIWQLNLKHPERDPREIIADSYEDELPHLSPDGKRIAFGSDRSGDQQIWVSSADGSNARKVTSFASADSLDVVWSRDSGSLIISVRSQKLGSKVYRTTDRDFLSLKEIVSDGIATSVSRNGQWVYFASLRGGAKGRIYRANLTDTSRVEAITDDEAMYGLESMDGRTFYFSKEEEAEGIWEQALPAGRARKVVDRISRRSLFAPGKSGLFFVADTSVGRRHQALYVKDFGGGVVRKLHDFEKDLSWGFDLSPDETRLLFSQYDLKNSDIMLVENFR